jgi:hypothetical protein
MLIIEQNRSAKPLLACLFIIGLVIIGTTYIDKQIGEITTDLMYVHITGALVILTLILAVRFRLKGSHGKAWALFLGAMTSWFIAETLWTVYELIYHVNPFPSLADVFYIAGYPFMLLFLINYIKPIKKAITRKMLVTAISVSIAMAIPGIYMAYSFDPKVSWFENIIATTYPIADSIIFVPAIIGISLFFRGEVNFTWSLICIGIVCSFLGDTGFQFAQFTETYYTGHPVDVVLLWSYILYAFGVYDHIKIFGKNIERNLNKISR